MAGGPNYSAEDQNKLPYFPQYQNQFMQINNGAYPYDCATPALNTSNLASGTQPMPLYQSWNQDANINMFMNSQNDSYYSNNNVYDHQSNTQYYQSTSDLGFTNNMEPESFSKKSELNNPKLDNSNIFGQADTIKYLNNVQPSTYNGCQDLSKRYIEVARNTESTYISQISRQQSDSYSPCATPHPAVDDMHASGYVGSNSLSASRKQTPKVSVDHAHKESIKEIMPAVLKSEENSKEKNYPHGRSVSDCRRKAQGAILSLWPYGVRYQTYLEEGFKEDVLEGLFNDLKMQKQIIADSKKSDDQLKVTSEPNASLSLENAESTYHKNKKPASNNDSSSLISSAPAPKQSQMAEKEKTLQSKMEALRKSREARATARTVLKTNSDQGTNKQSLTSENITSKNDKPPDSSANQLPIISDQDIVENRVQSSSQISSKLSSDSSKEPSTQLTETKSSSSDQIKPPTETPTIPGLFLVSNTTNIASRPPVNNSIRQRKRPVASDFDDSNTTPTLFKRPFGLSRSEQRVVIDVSDDESDNEDIPMELDSQSGQQSPAVLSIKISEISHAINSSSNSPAHNSSSLAPNNNTHLTSTASKQSLLSPSILEKKQREIQIMKKKIAEAEAQLKAKSASVSARTSQQPETGITDAKEKLNSINVPVTKLNGPEIKFIGIQEQVDRNQFTRTTPKNLPVIINTDCINDFAGEKNLRRQKIADELPIIEAEVQLGKSRLEKLKLEIAQVEAGLKRNLDEKQKMKDEMERLIQEKDITTVPDFGPRAEDLHQNQRTEPSENKAELLNNERDSPQSSPAVENSSVGLDKSYSPEPTLSCESTYKEAEQTSPDTTPNREFSPDNVEISSNEIIQVTQSHSVGNILIESSSHRVPEEVSKDADTAGLDSEGDNLKAENDNSHASEPTNLDLEINDSSMEEGELNSDYTPQLSAAEGPESESDNYEPPDATAPDQVSPVLSPPFSPAPPETIELSKNGQSQIIDSNQSSPVCQRDIGEEHQPHDNTSVSMQLVEVTKKFLWSLLPRFG